VQGAQGCTGTPSFIERISVARSRIEINPGDRIQTAMAFVSGTRLLKKIPTAERALRLRRNRSADTG
jgi:hypothetical protein